MRIFYRMVSAALIFAFWSVLPASSGAPGATATVNQTFRVTSDADPGSGGCDAVECTLREAISAANASPGLDTILWDVDCLDMPVPTVVPRTPLPTITDPVILDGSAPWPDGACPIPLMLNGSAAGWGAVGLRVSAGQSVIRHVSIYQFHGAGIRLEANGGNTLQSNAIFDNNGPGVAVLSGVGNRLQGNFIHDNGGLGIDHADDGVTLNDDGDADAGPNNLQNFPVISSLRRNDGGAVIGGALRKAQPNTALQIELYANEQCDPLNYGEGQTPLGIVNATTDSEGNAAFSLNYSGGTVVRNLTATATDAGGNTSEFSSCTPLLIVNSVADRTDREQGDGYCDTGQTIFRGEAGEAECTLRAAIQEANASAGRDAILFDIPRQPYETWPPVIQPNSPLPNIYGAVEIDATTQPPAHRVELDGSLAGGAANGLSIIGGNSAVSGLAIYKYGAAGILLSGGGNTVDGNILGSNSSLVPGALGNREGIFVNNSSNNTLQNNVVISNAVNLKLSGAGNRIVNNIFKSGANQQNASFTGGANTLNQSKSAGRNIVGGPFLGGNYWSDYTGADADGDKLGDTPHPFNGGNVDNLPLIGLPDLVVAAFTLDPADIFYSDNRYILPVDVTVRNAGLGDAASVVVRFTDGSGLDATQTIPQLAADASVQLHLDWDLTPILRPVNGKGAVQLTVAADPNNAINETDETNNRSEQQAQVDLRPRVTHVEPEYYPGWFMAGVHVRNEFQATLDWNGDMAGSAPAQAKTVFFELSGEQVARSVNNQTEAAHTFDMGYDMYEGRNYLRIRGQNVADFVSDPFIIQIHQTATPAWLNFVPAVQSAFHVERVIRAGPDYVIYRLAFKFPSEVIKAAVKAGAQAGPASGAFGPSIPAWELRYEGFSDGRGRVSGTAGTFAELKGKRFAAAGRTSELTYGGGVEGVIRVDSQDKWRMLELWAILRGSGKVKSPKWPLPAAPLFYVQLSGSLDLEGRLGAEENRATEQIDFMPNIYLRVEPGAEAAFVAGEKGLAWAEVAAGVKARGDFQFYQSPFVRSVLLRSYVRLAAGVLWFEKVQEWTWTWVIVGRQGQAAEVWLVGTPAATGGEWRPRARDHQRDPSGPLAGHAAGAGLTESYPFADPAAVYLGNGRTLAVWVTDDGSKPQHQALELRSAVWDGVQWGAPVSVTTDLIVDTQPTLVAAPGGAVAFWTRHSDAITGSVPTTPTQLFPQMEIAYAAYDALHNSWSAPQYLTHNGLMDFLPNAASAFTRTMALWLRDPDNNFPTFPTDTIALSEDVYYAVRAGADWIISPTLALPHIATAEQPQFVYNGLWAALVWSQDGDGNPTTLTDREVMYSTWNAAGAAWSPPQAITANGVADLSPRLALDSAGLAHLLWVQELAAPDNAGDVYQRLYHAAFDGHAWSAPALVREEANIEGLQLLAVPGNNLTAIWRAASDELSDLYHIFYDAQSAAWTPPAALTRDRAVEWAYDAVWDDANGRVFLTLLQREMGSQTVEIEFPLELAGRDARFAAGAPQITETVPISLPTFSRSNFLHLLHAPAPDLTLTAADIALTPANPLPGSAALISATVRNAGDLAANPVKVAFYDGDPAAGGLLIGQAQALGGPLTGGMTATLAVHWTVPTAPTAHNLYVKVDPQNEVAEGDETNNQAMARAALPDLHVAYGYADYANAGMITLTARISNTGGSPASNVLVELRQGDIAGTAIATRTLIALPAGAAQDVTFAWHLPGGTPISYAFWVLADPADAVVEGDETNNDGVLWADLLPDLTLTAADIGGFEPVTVTLRNSGYVTATAVTVALHRDQITGTLLYSGTVGAIAPGGAQTFTPTIPPGSYDLFVEIDPTDAIAELDESNNLAARRVDVAAGIKRLYLPLIMR